MTHKYFIVENIAVENLVEENEQNLSFFTNEKFFQLTFLR